MVLGLSTQTFTIIHVIISLLAIASGILVLVGMLRSNQMPGWTAFFLLTTILTSVIAWTRALRALWQASRRSLAMDLRRFRRRVPLSQRVGADCPVIPESAGTQTVSADPVRAAIPDCASDRAVRLCCAGHDCGVAISATRGFYSLTRAGQARREYPTQNGRSRRKRRLQPIGELAELI